MIQRSIHYKSDFKLRLANEIDWSTPFKLRFFTTRPVSAMEVGYDGTTYRGCSVDTEGKLVVTFDRFTQLHRQGLGALMMELSYNIDDDQFADRSFDRILAPQKVVCIDDEDNEFELVLGLNGDSHVEVECSVIAAYKKGDPGDTPEIGENGNWWIGGVDTEVKADYSSEEALRQSQEAARVAAETTRQSNETQRQSGETTRQSNESTRQSKETERQTNETARQNAEAQRQQTFSTNEAARQTAYQNAESNRNGAYEEAEQERDEEFASKEATRDAANQAALNCAETLAALGPKIGEIASVVGGIETEVQVDIASGKTWIDGKGVYAAGQSEGSTTTSEGSSYITITDISTYAGKKLYYSRRVSTSASNTGLAFYSALASSAVITGAGEVTSVGDSSGLTPSSIDIPQNAVMVRITCPTASKSGFYAYVKTTTTTEGLQKDVADLKDAVFDKQYSASSAINEKLFDVDIEANKAFTLKVSPSGSQNPTRVCVFANNNNSGNSRLFDSNLATNPYNTDIQITRGFAISSIDVAFFPVNGNGVNVLVTLPKGGISISANDILDGAISSQKLADNSVSAAKLADNSVNDSKIDVDNVSFLAVQSSTNLFNKDDVDIITGKYINAEGTTANNSIYNVSGYIPVEGGKTYRFTPNARTHEYYTNDKTVISQSFNGVSTNTSTAPVNAAYLRISYKGETEGSQMVNEGDETKPYEEYYPPKVVVDGSKIKKDSVKGESLKDESISLAKLNSDVKNAIKGGTLGRFVEQGEVAASEYLLLPKIHIQKNNLLACDIVGTIELVAVGVGYSASDTYGYRDYAALWVEVDATNIKQYRAYNDAPQLISTNAHGLTLTSHTKVVLDLSVTNGKAMIFTDNGGYYETSLQSAGVGKPFAYNGGTNSITCILSDYPRELAKKVWLFGDSYISFTATNRWPYYFAQNGHIDWFCNSQPGLSPESAYSDLQNMLTLGHRPKLLVWLLGMNGSTSESQVDGQYVINSSQKQYIDAVVRICNEYDIPLVLGVIPTVPTRQKTGFGIYVKSLGVRYIDFAAAVGTDSSGNWNEGLLSSDGVHPSVAGAKVLASQVYVDCPELAIIE